MSGRLKSFAKIWNEITSDKVILSWISGYKIPFNREVFQSQTPTDPKLSKSEFINMSVAIEELIAKGAVEICFPEEGQFISRTFLVPKPDGSYRFIINLKDLNQFIDPPHFKMEDGRTVTKLVSQDCYMASLDLKDAYYLIPIDELDRKYLRFTFNGILYQFTCLPFGLCTAPYVFTKVMKPVVYYLRKMGIPLVIYIDDLLIIGKSFGHCSNNVKNVELLLTRLGFLINYKKSQVTPSRNCKFLGVFYNSQRMTVELPEAKREKIISLTNKFKEHKEYVIQEFAETLGFLVSCCQAVKYGLVYTKSCEQLKFEALLKNNGNYKGRLKINAEVIKELSWWKNIGALSVNPIRYPAFDLEIFTDASKTGWGAACNGERAHGFWSKSEKLESINVLELTAVFFGLKCFAKNKKDCQILLRIDNTTAISYVNRMGGVQLKKLSNLAKEIWKWCEERNLWIFASYISSEDNTEADEESRKLQANTEFELKISAFNRIVKKFGKPDIDLFASRVNAKCKNYVSWKKDPQSIAVDAFTISWEGYYFYAFPPFSLIIRVLQKMQYDQSEGIVVVPYWPTQPWFPIFNSMLVSELLYLRADSSIIPVDRQTHFWKGLTLVAGILSSKTAREEEYLQSHMM